MIEIGEFENKTISFDLQYLVESRLLIQANSGGGKSYAIRRLIEQCYGQIQIIVLDLEGEFSTLREKYDFIIERLSKNTSRLLISVKTIHNISHNSRYFTNNIIDDMIDFIKNSGKSRKGKN